MSDFLRALFPNKIIRASAGTGKTFQLSNRYLRLLASGQDCDTILATTFTKKGAGEILDRIVGRLSAAALNVDEAGRLSQELEYQIDQPRAEQILHDLLLNMHRLEIGTLDSFFNRVAKAFSLELGLPPVWDIVEEQQIQQLHDDAIQLVLQKENVPDLLHMMSKGEANRRVATMIRDTVRYVYSVFRESKLEDWDKLAEQGHRLSEAELEAIADRVNEVVPKNKSFEKHWDEVSQMVNNGNWRGFTDKTAFQNFIAGNPKYGNSKLQPEVVEIFSDLLPHCAAIVSETLIWQNKATCNLVHEFSQIVEKTKDETGLLRFDDITTRLVNFVEFWDANRFVFRLDHQIQHLLLDEFQDTSPVQWQVLQPFAKQVTQDDPKRSFFCVGDMKQAIFGWRGGVAEIFDLVEQQLSNLGESEGLATSYRSSQIVMDLVNDVFMNLENFHCKDESVEEAVHSWGQWFEPHSTAKSLEGHCTVEVADDCDKALHQNDTAKQNARNDNVYKRAVERVRNLDRRLPADRTIGVLLRTNSGVGKMIFALQEAGIEASEEGGNALTDSAAVELVLSALQLADHPGDSVARFHLSHSPLADCFALVAETDENQRQNVAQACKAAADIRRRLIVEGYGPFIESLARRMVVDCTRRERQRLQHLVRVAYDNPIQFDRTALRPSAFVNYIRNELKVSDQSNARVRVMTIHKSKGLEFDAVIVPILFSKRGFSSMPPTVVVGRENPTAPIKHVCRYIGEPFRKLLPEEFQETFEQDRSRSIREAMCLLYVALTRGVHATQVIMSYSARADQRSTEAVLMSALSPPVDTGKRSKKAPALIGTIYEKGNRLWHRNLEAEERVESDLGRFYLPEGAELTPEAATAKMVSGRGLPVLLPSSLEGGQRLKMGTLFRRKDDSLAMERGRLIHACFQRLKWKDEAVPSSEHLIQVLQNHDPSTSLVEVAVADFLSLIEKPRLSALISHDDYVGQRLNEFVDGAAAESEAVRVEVQTERRFAVRVDEQMLTGTIDRLHLIRVGGQLIGADVIDFKSDSLKTASVDELTEYYRPQLESYRLAVGKMSGLPIEKIACRLVFLASDSVVTLERSTSESGEAAATDEPAASIPKSIPQPKILKSGKPKSREKKLPNQSDGGQMRLWDD